MIKKFNEYEKTNEGILDKFRKKKSRFQNLKGSKSGLEKDIQDMANKVSKEIGIDLNVLKVGNTYNIASLPHEIMIGVEILGEGDQRFTAQPSLYGFYDGPKVELDTLIDLEDYLRKHDWERRNKTGWKSGVSESMINEEFQSTGRNYAKELNTIAEEVEAELYNGLEYCMERGIFEKEDLGRGEFWYKFPTIVGVSLNWTNDIFAVSEFMPEGEKVGNYTIGKGGYLFGELDNNNEHQVDTYDLDVWGMIDLLEEVRKWCDVD